MIDTYLPQGYFLEFSREQRGFLRRFCGQHDIKRGFLHRFCGRHDISGASCPNCAKPLLRFFSFDTSDPMLAQLHEIAPHVHLLFCWTCNVAHSPFFYRLLPDGAVQLIEYGHDGVETDFPYGHYPRHFPGGYTHLVPISPEQQEAIIQLNSGEISPYDEGVDTELYERLAVPTHQLGGEPWLVQPDFSLDCPECSHTMRFLASVGDLCLLPQGFVDNDYVQVGYSICPSCQIIGAVQRCD